MFAMKCVALEGDRTFPALGKPAGLTQVIPHFLCPAVEGKPTFLGKLWVLEVSQARKGAGLELGHLEGALQLQPCWGSAGMCSWHRVQQLWPPASCLASGSFGTGQSLLLEQMAAPLHTGCPQGTAAGEALVQPAVGKDGTPG